MMTEGFLGVQAWRCPTLTWGSPTLPSALSGFTSEFGMGSGGSHSLLSSGNSGDSRHKHKVCPLHHVPNNSINEECNQFDSNKLVQAWSHSDLVSPATSNFCLY